MPVERQKGARTHNNNNNNNNDKCTNTSKYQHQTYQPREPHLLALLVALGSGGVQIRALHCVHSIVVDALRITHRAATRGFGSASEPVRVRFGGRTPPSCAFLQRFFRPCAYARRAVQRRRPCKHTSTPYPRPQCARAPPRKQSEAHLRRRPAARRWWRRCACAWPRRRARALGSRAWPLARREEPQRGPLALSGDEGRQEGGQTQVSQSAKRSPLLGSRASRAGTGPPPNPQRGRSQIAQGCTSGAKSAAPVAVCARAKRLGVHARAAPAFFLPRARPAWRPQRAPLAPHLARNGPRAHPLASSRAAPEAGPRSGGARARGRGP